ncbi:hypothetical protein BYT27DRAFT_7229123 [Phlegmacium glaucopus]|nr:hypothetical protein BYT27DRAFT_7229123 [Phlegmacium glaucopus]
MFNSLTLPVLLITLLCFYLDSSAGSCMPCHEPNRRDAPWDRSLSTRGLYIPKITSPTNNTTWIIGSYVTVTWDLHDMPKNVSNQKGSLMLGYLEDGSDDEHLQVEHPLAEGFDIKSGFVSIKCPDVDPDKQYIVVLFGDSGNRSPQFSIRT